jgi:hypothetical protein
MFDRTAVPATGTDVRLLYLVQIGNLRGPYEDLSPNITISSDRARRKGKATERWRRKAIGSTAGPPSQDSQLPKRDATSARTIHRPVDRLADIHGLVSPHSAAPARLWGQRLAPPASPGACTPSPGTHSGLWLSRSGYGKKAARLPFRTTSAGASLSGWITVSWGDGARVEVGIVIFTSPTMRDRHLC